MLIAERAFVALPLFLFVSCISPATISDQTVVGTISMSGIEASTGELMGAVGGVYKVEPEDGTREPILLIIEAPCPFFNAQDLKQNDPKQVFRIKYRSSGRARETILRPGDPAHLQTDNITVHCEPL